jgi:hypothetical protein
MNPLGLYTEQLGIKPAELECHPVIVHVGTPEGVSIIDERGEDYSDESFKDRLKRSRLKKVSIRESIGKESMRKESGASIERESVAPPSKKIKKLTEATLRGLEEGIEEGEDFAIELPKTSRPGARKRRTAKPLKGVERFGPGAMIQIGNTPMSKRLPKREQPVNIQSSAYYLNNREIFVNFLNDLFEPYRQELLDDSAGISCANIGNQSQDFSLLTHQKIVRDYLNLYTPYRGLLLYHGLGSGKTCTSIAIAEGMKSGKQIIIMTPASLKRNYMEEIKKCGDVIYKKNNFWEWISTDTNPETMETLSAVLGLPLAYIKKKRGAWLMNVSNPEGIKSNYDSLTPEQKASLEEQQDEMIENKYKFISYNGLRTERLREMTENYSVNLFDNAVVIIDEAHNFISRIVNKISKEKPVETDKKGQKRGLPSALSLKLYEYLLSASNARIVLLSGTPIINYPNEIGILFNILRGYIKTWNFPLDIKTSAKINRETLTAMLEAEKALDYIDYSPSNKTLTVTRNPLGFNNKFDQRGYKGVSNEGRVEGTTSMDERGQISDANFEGNIIRILRANDIAVLPTGVSIQVNKALPDKLDDFLVWFIDAQSGHVKNIELFKRRVIGLTSYFRSAQEGLMPNFNKIGDFHVIKIPMSDYQFGVYEQARQQERKIEKNSKMKKGKVDKDGIYKEPSSTYRIFSRLYCNFVMPKSIGRPLPGDGKIENIEAALKEVENAHNDVDFTGEGEVEGDEIIDEFGDMPYQDRIKAAVEELNSHAGEYLSKEGLEIYSRKYLHMLDNIQDPENQGLHLVYSQFRTLEGIGIFMLVLIQNGFAQFKIKKNSLGAWEIDMPEEDLGKPTFALYTGTETAEEKEIIRNIYNGDWGLVKEPAIVDRLKTMSNNNNMGQIIKVFMITASGSEGINLRNTRYVHIMEPYWHPVRIEQVIGRARRICSHQGLPKALQTVEVFLYLMTFSPEQIASDASIELKRQDLSKRRYMINPAAKLAIGEETKEGETKEGETKEGETKEGEAKEGGGEKKKSKSKAAPTREELQYIPFTSDEALFEISTIKEEVSSHLTKAIKEASIDCAVHTRSGSTESLVCLNFGNPTAETFSYTPSINADETDKIASINKRTIDWKAVEIELNGKKYILREGTEEVYDFDSVQLALENNKSQPILMGYLTMDRGEYIFTAK